MSFFDSQSIEIPCPKCGAKHPKTIGWIKANDKIVCGCGATLDLEKSQFVGELGKVEDELNALPKNITIKI